jgi:hypothetical protein
LRNADFGLRITDSGRRVLLSLEFGVRNPQSEIRIPQSVAPADCLLVRTSAYEVHYLNAIPFRNDGSRPIKAPYYFLIKFNRDALWRQSQFLY